MPRHCFVLDELTRFALVLKGSSSVLVHSLDGGEERALVIRPLPRGSCFSMHSKKIGVLLRHMALSRHCRGPCETERAAVGAERVFELISAYSAATSDSAMSPLHFLMSQFSRSLSVRTC